MTKDFEKTSGGSTVLRHSRLAPTSTDIAHADDARLTAHLARELGGESMVWHEIVSDRVHLDVHVFMATRARPFHVLVTSGMSARPMSVPPKLEAYRHAELCMTLAPDWPLDQKAFADEGNYWPVRLLKTLARIPHDYRTWLGYGHSIPNGDPAGPYAAGVPYTGALITTPYGLGDTITPVPGTPPIHVWQVLPVTSAEMDLKLRVGIDGVLDHFEADRPDRLGPIART